jgi:hypothetical protein
VTSRHRQNITLRWKGDDVLDLNGPIDIRFGRLVVTFRTHSGFNPLHGVWEAPQ